MVEMLLASGVPAAVRLSELIAENAVNTVGVKLNAHKMEKNAEKLQLHYEEIINTLLSERSDALQIAQLYKQELDRIEISEEDMTHLQNTFANIVRIFAGNIPVEQIAVMNSLISVDTLKTMQLLGFNYKAAIGQPLTEVCAEKITNWGLSEKTSGSNPHEQDNLMETYEEND